MQTILLYLLIMAIVVAAVFAVVWFAFGRGEDLPPIERGTTLTTLPPSGITSDDVRALRFAQTLRGYKQSEVDWALARLAAEIDELRGSLADLHARNERVCPSDATADVGAAEPAFQTWEPDDDDADVSQDSSDAAVGNVDSATSGPVDVADPAQT
ncbi:MULTISPECIES: DivIVA domain-containing protein [unclassified Gordonia (in: high G+C Gram-positive bacteria)]|uniref:DivIVA domain-containing protein n=1 Tax=unclassified Gordonia (in: high G+C Gram-positive bacteria) TaxID=2657482 RepID=UPI001F0D769C|nr:DivIVA domain-containing protein [Gordonia sp. ABSL49_1]MCH5643744.1 DivIVA domain-containing protein [Gordonia sp. ABSL49_1]